MESTLPLPFIVDASVNLNGEAGLSKEQLACLGTIFFEVTPQNLGDVRSFLQPGTSAFEPYLDVTQLESANDILSLLDSGARKVFVKPEQLKDYEEHGSRVGQAVDGTSLQVSAAENGLLVSGIDASGDVSTLVQQFNSKKGSPLFIRPADGADLELCAALARQVHATVILPSSRLTACTKDATGGKVSISKLLASNWTSDRGDKLLPTVVTDDNGIALGLVYSSEESIGEALRTCTGVYQSRKRGLWYKGATSGDTQELVRISLDCDNDALKFVVRQKGRFCHLDQFSCFGNLGGIAKLEQTLTQRRESAPAGSYTARLFSDEKLLRAKIMEEAEELCDAKTKENVAFEAADLIYFALTKAVASGVSLSDIERNLDAKSWKVKRRTGDAKGKWAEKEGIKPSAPSALAPAPAPAATEATSDRIAMKVLDVSQSSVADIQEALKRPSQKSSDAIMKIIGPIVDDVRTNGDKAVLSYTHKFEKATSLTSPVLKAPFPEEMMRLSPETAKAIDISFENIRKFHAAQKEDKPLRVETMPGVVCSRFSRPIERVGLYVPGGTAVLPSTALMLGVPAMVAGCQRIVLASPPRQDGTVTPEIVYVAHKVGAESIVLAGGAQAVAAMAYGTESVTKVDKILGPGNQFVTAAKMLVSNDTNAGVGIDMPAGPSEVLVIADCDANPAFVASDLLSQAEHGVDSQVVLIAVDLDEAGLKAIEDEVHRQAMALPRVDIVRGSIKHSITISVRNIEEAMRISNDYAPEHLILQLKNAEAVVDMVMNAGSVFIGQWTPESVGDYSAGVNHSLPTYGYAKQYSGVNLGSFVKHITSSNLTADGLRNVGEAVMQLAKVEELEAHRRAVSIRMEYMNKQASQ
ncbi:imidazoleglycerol-phosphate dehydratase [Pyricularia oryzae]|uniref:Histidine biosynthesis trifunctional protein n=2 Tax=Pyricularia TaxID=48558 RepID=A0ABQ8NIJ7_PYRGI|nr:imidazoleglycerol-phosphate dehydratase [Pyricularia oryzae]KAI6297698.1 imidazoleglycerol-phosphate dehydratase [Pyricularia grisea]KAH9438485.1 imidazoleglycerol-phosphate dehydratase [Pyricularia oryzae]KAI6254467.1 imidazoleglycerol-phosphate dehydratase [Pyricularia oryzae]KAI6265343.1 imidazoleglycerol-phosphate dehydratase [Pyricularia oryzae]